MRRETSRRAGELAAMRRQVIVLLLPLVLLGLAAGADEPQGAAAAKVQVRLTEYAIEMPETLAPGPTLFEVHNEGEKKHSLKLEGPGIDEMLGAVVKPHETGTLQVTLQPGEYKVYCPIGSHSAKGMSRTLTVRAQPPS